MSEGTQRSQEHSIKVTAADFMPNTGALHTVQQTRTMEGREQETYASLAKSNKINKVNPPILKPELTRQKNSGAPTPPLHPQSGNHSGKLQKNSAVSSAAVSRKGALLAPDQNALDFHPDSDQHDAFGQALAKRRQEEFQREKEIAKARIEPVKLPLQSEQLCNIGEKPRYEKNLILK